MNKKIQIAGLAAGITATAGLVTAVYGSHSTVTNVARDDSPVVINRPRDANGSPLPVSVEKLPNGQPLIIVGNGAPGPCPSPSPTPTRSGRPSPTPSPTQTPTDDC